MQIEDLWCIQRKIDKEHVLNLTKLDHFKTKIVLARLENGDILILNGHHRISSLWLKGRRELDKYEYILSEVDEFMFNRTNLKIPDLLRTNGIFAA